MTRERRGVWRVLMGFALRSTVLHVATYMIIGAASYWLLARSYWTGPDALPWLRDPEAGFVQRWLFPAQILRGILHGIALFPFRNTLLEMRRWGGAAIAALLLLIGSIAGISGVIEDWVYSTTFHGGLFLVHLPEVVLQTLLYGYGLLAWERRVQRRHGGT
ncbi:MAG TPA: hypothetical protein VK886_01270 [Vicinamibacterales bacterium]|nr:hypothetical protein [Vicinamibacterales bacterium]